MAFNLVNSGGGGVQTSPSPEKFNLLTKEDTYEEKEMVVPLSGVGLAISRFGGGSGGAGEC